ncbi:UNKNOWN [Stylonychia lemnae]|uniref:Uncharacterized protein n=1 Tax=Stylonychia lemnae TaxID=5949 RepID=A0A077ZW07_STYLE|nr:UNKNOWN [Stylonychia lemnae]|eukprot:CDW72626.1 UNKNOWN [Stylonychia lemnae]
MGAVICCGGPSDLDKILHHQRMAIERKQQAIQDLNELKIKLEQHINNCKIAASAGNIAQIAGTLMLFSPLAPIGAITLAAGAATNLGTDITLSKIEGNTMKNVTDLLENDSGQTAEFIDILTKIGEKIQEKAEKKLKKMAKDKVLKLMGKDSKILKLYKSAKNLKKFTKAFEMASKLQKAAKVAGTVKTATSVAKSLKGGLLIGIGLGINIYELVSTWKSDNETVKKLNDIINDLKEQLNDLHQLQKVSEQDD